MGNDAIVTLALLFRKFKKNIPYNWCYLFNNLNVHLIHNSLKYRHFKLLISNYPMLCNT